MEKTAHSKADGQLASCPAVPTGQQLNGARLVVKLLEQQGVTHVAGIPGGANREMIEDEA